MHETKCCIALQPDLIHADSSDARDEPHLSHTTSSRARGGMGTEMNTRARAVVGGEGDAPEGEIL